MTAVLQFVPRAHLTAEENCAAFVNLCRNDLQAFGSSLPFDSNVWEVSESVSAKGKKHEGLATPQPKKADRRTEHLDDSDSEAAMEKLNSVKMAQLQPSRSRVSQKPFALRRLGMARASGAARRARWPHSSSTTSRSCRPQWDACRPELSRISPKPS